MASKFWLLTAFFSLTAFSCVLVFRVIAQNSRREESRKDPYSRKASYVVEGVVRIEAPMEEPEPPGD